ncbi:hypothetical protein PZ897_00580 [Hoeflea sp. YIM 152468]|uniref:hypothetical protein n=1 Tax=Hoeflea sp. YIM 152468 TaxID=3031759 RepID=UPI0023DBF3B8|nr:hypothetical protein [Hoeflea sp. YIM 152468]MDF1606662.1 hypothetical protein [Hoeflea sp. YIM 152468]
MSRTQRNFRAFMSPVSRFFDGAADSFRFASEANRLIETPDHVFRSRGITREKAIRDLMSRI